MIHRLAEQSRTTPSATAFRFRDRRVNYGELAERARRIAADLDDRGIDDGDRVALIADNRPRWIFAACGVFWQGATLVPISPRATADEIEQRLEIGDCDLVVADDTAAVDDALSLTTLTTDAGHGANSEPADEPPRWRDDDSLLTILFTSGSTGTPRAVPLTVRNHLASAVASGIRLGRADDDHWLCCLSMSHIGGLAILLRSLVYGTSFELTRRFDADAVADLLERRTITMASFVPTMLHRLLAAGPKRFDTDLRTVLVGGGPISGDELREARRRGLPVVPTYGMTEAASQLATLDADAPAGRLDTAGRPLPGVTLQIRRDDGTVADPGEPGAIFAKGPMLTDGPPAASQPQRPRRASTSENNNYGWSSDGWFCTGDIGAIDDDGFVTIHHRAGSRIITGGENVDPREVEAALRGADNVDDAAVVGVDDAEWGQLVAAAVAVDTTVDAANAPGLIEQINNHCRSRLAGFKTPRRWAIFHQLPTTATGKVHRRQIRDLLASPENHPDVVWRSDVSS